jgi:hypothetical protein
MLYISMILTNSDIRQSSGIILGERRLSSSTEEAVKSQNTLPLWFILLLKSERRWKVLFLLILESFYFIFYFVFMATHPSLLFSACRLILTECHLMLPHCHWKKVVLCVGRVRSLTWWMSEVYDGNKNDNLGWITNKEKINYDDDGVSLMLE